MSTSLSPLEKRILDLVFDAWAKGEDLDLTEVADSIMALIKEENEACARICLDMIPGTEDQWLQGYVAACKENALTIRARMKE